VYRRERLIATSAKHTERGRRTLRVSGRFAARMHTVRVELTGPAGAIARDEVALYPSRVLATGSLDGELAYPLADRVASEAQDEGEIGECRRQSPRRIDCVALFNGRCLSVLAVLLRTSGVIFTRSYSCRSQERPFRLHPRWRDPAIAL